MSRRLDGGSIGPSVRIELCVAIFISAVPLACDEESAFEGGEDSSYRTASAGAMVGVGPGSGATCLVTASGQIECWGRTTAGAGSLSLAEAERVSLDRPAQQVRGGADHRVALTDDGMVYVWGDIPAEPTSPWGGERAPAFSLALQPTPVGFAEPVVEVIAGVDFGCARMQAGGVRCWGNNAHGQLGRGDTHRIGDDEAPGESTELDLGEPAIDLGAGGHHACAVLASGLVQCWGRNESGQLGRGHSSSIGDDEGIGATDAIDLGRPAVAVVAGQQHTCALLDDGEVRCWGSNEHGQLGSGPSTSASKEAWSPPAVGLELGGAVADVVAGARHTCALLDAGALHCWGGNAHGQLGRGHIHDIGDDEATADVLPIDLGGRLAVAVFAGPAADTTFVMLDHGGLRSWGNNDQGQLGHSGLLTIGDEQHEPPGELPDIIIDDAHDED